MVFIAGEKLLSRASAFIIQVVGAAHAADAHAPVNQTLKG